jgi:4-hydroxythreonine-4-phosphate dehydrogenase
MGDPAGVGPELCVWALRDPEILAACRPVVVGSAAVLDEAASRIGQDLGGIPRSVREEELPERGPAVLDIPNIKPSSFHPGAVSAECGRSAYEYIELAVGMAMRRGADAIVTAPINKTSLNLGGISEPGHTEILARLAGTSMYAMLQYSPKLVVSFVTTHQAVSRVSRAITKKRIVEVARLTADFLRRLRGAEPSLGILALNPHAGEEGLFGNEEAKTIVPAIRELQEAGIRAEGPLVPDAAFVDGKIGLYDGYVAMYHDQGHIPFKMLGFFEGVNVTLGLPIIRTSVDHGTAFDIAWQGRVNPGSIRAAILLAARLAGGAGSL